ncbi:hypothetical protein [Phaeocystidibacter luteus]|uniref:Peptidyl-prolyl cis-trans isomerase n=1 Tax=Phaeocystidibacter luteus TaxID=911197 RepID=A0A6N6RK28_9FLAO|nr:hypothetical protein [Phaeocystidibacter luteus]KAB2814261.1 hypothetical protein F8C67_00595 [Phaeocystidibacter luteus]
MIRKVLYIVIAASTLSSCEFAFGEEDKGAKVARVYDAVLYAEDIREVMPSGMSPEDSATWARKYINNWGKEQLIIKKAEFNLADQEKDFDELVEQYRSDLLKFTYQQRYVSENLDTAVTPEQIQEYYDAHQSEFELKENILKLNYLVLNVDAPDVSDVRKWFRSDDEDNRTALQDYAFKYGRSSSFEDTNWVRYNDLAKFIPLQTYNQQQFIRNNKYVEISDSTGVYFVEILKYKIADDVSPLPYVKETIRNIILNKRKQELIVNMEARIVNDAYEKNDFEIYSADDN